MPKRIIVVGAGTGGTFTANLLASRLKKQIKHGEIEINLFGDRPDHSFQPGFLDVAFRGQDPSKVTRDESSLLDQGVRLHQTAVNHIDLNKRSITTRDNGDLLYDYLVIATGASIHAEAIPGLAESALNFHTNADKSAEIWRALQNFEGGRIVLAVAGLPHKCPASPNEASFVLDDYLRHRGIRDRSEIIFATPYPRIYPAPGVSQVVEPLYEERRIEVVHFFNVDSVDSAQKKIYSLEGDALDFDLLLAVPPHWGAEVVRSSGIGDKEGWIATNKYELNIIGYDDAYALGDATNLPISKTGVVAHLEAKVVVENILADLEGLDVRHKFNGRINCPFETGGGKGTFVIATYESPPKPIQPTRLNFWMKRGFSYMYWTTLSGRWEPLFNLYFGRTSMKALRTQPLSTHPLLQTTVKG